MSALPEYPLADRAACTGSWFVAKAGASIDDDQVRLSDDITNWEQALSEKRRLALEHPDATLFWVYNFGPGEQKRVHEYHELLDALRD